MPHSRMRDMIACQSENSRSHSAPCRRCAARTARAITSHPGITPRARSIVPSGASPRSNVSAHHARRRGSSHLIGAGCISRAAQLPDNSTHVSSRDLQHRRVGGTRRAEAPAAAAGGQILSRVAVMTSVGHVMCAGRRTARDAMRAARELVLRVQVADVPPVRFGGERMLSLAHSSRARYACVAFGSFARSGIDTTCRGRASAAARRSRPASGAGRRCRHLRSRRHRTSSARPCNAAGRRGRSRSVPRA